MLKLNTYYLLGVFSLGSLKKPYQLEPYLEGTVFKGLIKQ